MNKYDEILKKFLGTDGIRPVLQSVHRDGDFLVATNTHVLIKMPVGYTDEVYGPVEKYPDYTKVIPDIEMVSPLKLSLGSLLKAYASFENEMIDNWETKECTDCEGMGSITCEHCKYAHDCEKCKGQGVLNIKIIGRMVPYSNNKILIDNGLFNPEAIRLAGEVAELHAVKEILWFQSFYIKAALLKIDDITVLIMPCYYDDLDKIRKEEKVIEIPI